MKYSIINFIEILLKWSEKGADIIELLKWHHGGGGRLQGRGDGLQLRRDQALVPREENVGHCHRLHRRSDVWHHREEVGKATKEILKSNDGSDHGYFL